MCRQNMIMVGVRFLCRFATNDEVSKSNAGTLIFQERSLGKFLLEYPTIVFWNYLLIFVLDLFFYMLMFKYQRL